MRWFRLGQNWWTWSSVVGLGVSSGLLALALHDEARRRTLGVGGAVRIASEAAVVLKVQLTVYFGLCCLTAAAPTRGERIALAVAGNAVLTGAALYRLRVRRLMIRFVEQEASRARLRNRRATDHTMGEAAGE